MPVTTTRAVAESSINVSVLAVHATLASGKLAKEGNHSKKQWMEITSLGAYMKARLLQKSFIRMVENITSKSSVQIQQLGLFKDEASKLDEPLRITQQQGNFVRFFRHFIINS